MNKPNGLGETLVAKGYIYEDQLAEATRLSVSKNIKLVDALLELKLVKEEVILKVLSKHLRLPIKSKNDIKVDINVPDIISEKLVKTHICFPFEITEDAVKVLVWDPLNLKLEDDIFQETNLRSEFYLGYRGEIMQLINEHYGTNIVIIEVDETEDEDDDLEDLSTAFDIGGQDNMSPIIKVTNSIFKNAVNEGASDIHIGATERKIEVRYRIDGILHKVRELPKRLQPALVSRIKTMADMDITERRVPQDGRIQINLNGKSIDMRVSSLPSVNGEKITIRLLDKGNLLMDIKELGFQPKIEEEFEGLINSPVGIILITGPTGSGKSSTLYTVINELNDESKNIITIEDPVEYKLDGIVQVNVNTKSGMTFAEGLKAILRQDPDIILIGEIRDKETAGIAVKASNTGHLVFATLHTNDAVSTIVRLMDMEVEPYLVAGTVKGVINQRLVRRICPHCKVSYKSADYSEEKAFFGIPDFLELKLYKGTGCEKCKNTGYKGRVAVHELFLMNNELRKMIASGASESEIRTKAVEMGMTTMKQDGFDKALEGLTTLEEVRRFVTMTED
ncbi:GspE/PulE family protein [Priestia filamentosa]|uniref:GspE/PulE family protein n=1 Tax=Priestia filamentosa TaxID=1402861 RepID=UPI0005890D43